MARPTQNPTNKGLPFSRAQWATNCVEFALVSALGFNDRIAVTSLVSRSESN